MALVTITFEVNDDSPLIDGCENVQDSLHEALCLFIHENDEDALDWLQNNIEDISDDE